MWNSGNFKKSNGHSTFVCNLSEENYKYFSLLVKYHVMIYIVVA